MNEEKNILLSQEEIDALINDKLRKIFEANFKNTPEPKPRAEAPKPKPDLHKHEPGPKPKHHIHPEPIKLNFDFDSNIETLINVFKDESTTNAIIKTLKQSPVEIQVIAKLIIDLHQKFDDYLGE